jgi:hypothetical protein
MAHPLVLYKSRINSADDKQDDGITFLKPQQSKRGDGKKITRQHDLCNISDQGNGHMLYQAGKRKQHAEYAAILAYIFLAVGECLMRLGRHNGAKIVIGCKTQKK